MKKKLLITGGVMNTLFALFHILLAVMIQQTPEFSLGGKALMQAFNVFATGIMFYLAYMAFFCQDEMLKTKLGRVIMSMVSFIYLTRAIEEFVLFKFSFFIFIPCVVLGGIHIALLVLTAPEQGIRHETQLTTG